jgi:hypothetical protein
MNLSYFTEFFLARETFNFMPIQVAGNHAVYGVLQEILQSKRPGT